MQIYYLEFAKRKHYRNIFRLNEDNFNNFFDRYLATNAWYLLKKVAKVILIYTIMKQFFRLSLDTGYML